MRRQRNGHRNSAGLKKQNASLGKKKKSCVFCEGKEDLQQERAARKAATSKKRRKGLEKRKRKKKRQEKLQEKKN